MGDVHIIFRQGRDGTRQRKKYEGLLSQDIFSTRYFNNKFLSLLIYFVSPKTASTIQFPMFNVEYKYTIDQITELLGFPQGEGVSCEAPIETD